MQHLYPALAKIGFPAIKRIVLLLTVVLYSVVAKSQTLNFTASLINDKVALEWSNSGGPNTSHFIIERSYDNKNYDQVALFFTAEEATAKNSYSYKDPVKNAAASIIYYRLKMVDKNGRFKHSDIRFVRQGNGKNPVKVAYHAHPVVTEIHNSR